MNLIKKFSKEISVFGIVLIVFLSLFAYRQLTFKDFKTINESQLTQMIDKKEDFVVIIGNSKDPAVMSYQDIMQTYTTKNRSNPLYFVDSLKIKDIDQYVQKKFGINATYPITLIIKDGKLATQKEGVLQYYSLYDFIKENDVYK